MGGVGGGWVVGGGTPIKGARDTTTTPQHPRATQPRTLRGWILAWPRRSVFPAYGLPACRWYTRSVSETVSGSHLPSTVPSQRSGRHQATPGLVTRHSRHGYVVYSGKLRVWPWLPHQRSRGRRDAGCGMRIEGRGPRVEDGETHTMKSASLPRARLPLRAHWLASLAGSSESHLG